ncbi:MAG: malate synthase A [bacterium]|nr:malate synthase A [bacterium]
MNTDVRVRGPKVEGDEKILTPEALRFVGELNKEFGDIRRKNLEWRDVFQRRLDTGDFRSLSFGNTVIRTSEWKVVPAPKDLEDRRVEITGPASSRKMVINALNSGANCYMADSEDSDAPTWANIVNGQINLFDAVRRQIDFETGRKKYALKEKTAVQFFRPRGWHLPEKHVLVDGKPMSASLFDFGMYFFHNAQALVDKGTGVYLYLPKMESSVEAMLWDAIFRWSEDQFGLPRGIIRATVLIETLPAAFQMEEILYALREHSAGLNCGRWDYIFSYIKKLSAHPRFVLPDRSTLKMDGGFLAPYADLLVETCHKRGALAMGGMAAQSPSKDEKVNIANSLKVKADSAREIGLGFDGKWVSHPAYVPDVKEIFDLGMPGPNQLDVLREDVHVTAEDLLRVPKGAISGDGVYSNVSIGIQYLEAWLRGVGCVTLNNLMEDAATAEISRAQIWQWRKHNVEMCSAKALDEVIKEVMQDLRGLPAWAGGKFNLAEKIFREMVFSEKFPEFLTLAAYDHLVVSA